MGVMMRDFSGEKELTEIEKNLLRGVIVRRLRDHEEDREKIKFRQNMMNLIAKKRRGGHYETNADPFRVIRQEKRLIQEIISKRSKEVSGTSSLISVENI